MLFISNLAAFLTEYLFIRNKKNGKVSMAVFVTGSLLACTLPPTLPLWMVAVGAAFALSFGKMVYGGFGMNVFNPAIVGRAFLYICFPEQMTVTWIKSYQWHDYPGGLVHWLGEPAMRTSATLMAQLKHTGSTDYSFLNAFLGFIPGSLGETSALLISIAAIYLIVTKTAKWQPMLATTLSWLLFSLILDGRHNPLFTIVTGGALFGIVFMTTDPVTQAKGRIAIWVYGLLIGFLTVFIKKYSLFYGGMMFAILLTNAVMPIVEIGLDKWFPLAAKGGKA